MKSSTSEYLSLRNLAIKYDMHPDTIRKKKLIEGIHYIKIGKSIRYHVKNMDDFLINKSNKDSFDFDIFLIDKV